MTSSMYWCCRLRHDATWGLHRGAFATHRMVHHGALQAAGLAASTMPVLKMTAKHTIALVHELQKPRGHATVFTTIYVGRPW